MTPLDCILITVAVLLGIALWLQSRLAFAWTGFLQERLRAVDQERDKWAAERETLLTRIQAWEAPKPEPEREIRTSRGPDDARPETPDDDHTDQMRKRGLRSNTEGGYLDEFGHLFWTFGAYDEWLAYKEANKLPADANPLDFMAT